MEYKVEFLWDGAQPKAIPSGELHCQIRDNTIDDDTAHDEAFRALCSCLKQDYKQVHPHITKLSLSYKENGEWKSIPIDKK